MRRLSCRVQAWALWHPSPAFSTAAADPLEIDSEIVNSVCYRGPKVTSLPTDIANAIDTIVSRGPRKSQIRESGRLLTDRLKVLSRTRHRGGHHPNLGDDATPAVVPRGKPRQTERRILSQLRQHAPVALLDDMPLQDEYIEPVDKQILDATAKDAVAAHSSSNVSLKARVDTRGHPLYDDQTTLAYAATRLAGCYAALHHVMGQLRRVAGEQWRPTSMLDFGAGPATGVWAADAVWPVSMDSPPLQATAVEKSHAMMWMGHEIQQHRFDPGGQELPAGSVPARIRWMSRLPERKGKGYDLVVAGYVLSELAGAVERRRIIDALWRSTCGYLVIVEPGTPAGFSNVHFVRDYILKKADEDNAEAAHVAAPCPHDGPCPLRHHSSASWCHFAQRFHRTDLQRVVKAFPEQLPPRSYQDERFSYVILARGPRRPPPPQVVISDFRVALDDDDDELVYVPTRSLRPKRIITQYDDDTGDDPDTPQASTNALMGFCVEEKEESDLANGLDKAVEELILGNFRNEEGEDDEELPPEVLQELRTAVAEATGHGNVQTVVDGHAESDDDSSDAFSLSSSDEEGSTSEDDQHEVVSTPARGATGPEAEVATAKASTVWSRLLRPPRKRSGHVILDMCSSMDTRGRYLGGREGVLLRQVVSRRLGFRMRGAAGAYQSARRARWGGLWPLQYQRALGSNEISTNPMK